MSNETIDNGDLDKVPEKSEEKYNPITQGPIGKQILIFFFPIMVGTVFQLLYNTADAIIVGRFLGKVALAATGGATTVIINLVVMFFVNMSSGASVIISQFYGAKETERLQLAVHTAVALAITGGVIIMIAGILGMPGLLHLVNSPEDVYPQALIYLRVYFAGMVGNLVYNIGSSILRAVGDSKRPLYFLIVSCFANIILDILFVAVIPMGVAGAAFATILSQLISAICVMWVLMRTKEIYRVQLGKLRLDSAMLKRIFHIGLPAGIQGSTFSISNLFIQTVLNGFGTDIVAAWSVFSKIDAFFWGINGALGVAATTFSGQNYGARRMDRVKKCANVCLLMFVGFAVVTSILMHNFSVPLMRIFTSDVSVVEYGKLIMSLLTPFYLLYAITDIYGATIRGTGHTMVPMMLNIIGICGFRLVWIFCVVPMKRDLVTVVINYPITWALTSAMFFVYYWFGSWKKTEFKAEG